MAREAEKLKGKKDAKLNKAITLVKNFLKEGYRPILFCRFIPTAEYVAEALRDALPKDVSVTAVTGTLPPAEREERIIQLAENPKRVLVCTDCLSEGINLQDYFDAVMHYDLSWNPTRHEQREGRVDRFGQPREKVRVLTYYGIDNQIDGIVLDVLLRKHKKIKSSLGISVPVPANTEMVVEAIFEGLLLRERSGQRQLTFDFMKETRKDLHTKWDNATEREKRSRTIFAQESIKVDEVAKELQIARSAVGSGSDVQSFIYDALNIHGATISEKEKYTLIDLKEIPRSLKDALSISDSNNKLKAKFDLPVDENVVYLNRIHPMVEALAGYVMNTSLDPILDTPAKRSGVIRTNQVAIRTTLLLVRFRYHIITITKDAEIPLLAEDCRVLGFRGAPDKADWINESEAEKLLMGYPDVNITADVAKNTISKILDGFSAVHTKLEDIASDRAQSLLEDHRRVRTAAKVKGMRFRVEPHLPTDVLGIYVYLPVQ